jgi:O-6-methylguanine DNA methyltransferase
MNYFVDNKAMFSEVCMTELGWVGVLGSHVAISKIAFPHKTRESVESSLQSFSNSSLLMGEPGDLVSYTCQEIARYIGGENVIFNQILDLVGTKFQIDVWNTVRNIPLGETRSYSWVAESINNPKAVRAIGNAMSRNPVPIIIPCHRVIGKDGSMTGYGGKLGVGIKAKLLKLEVILALTL